MNDLEENKMFCRNCGKKIEDGVKFCPHCGAPAAAGQEGDPAPVGDVILDALNAQPEAAPVSGAAVPAAEEGAAPLPAQEPVVETGNSRRRLGVLAGLGGAAAVLIVAAAVLLSGMLGSPKSTLDKAVNKSINAYQAASDAIGMPDLKELSENKKVRTDMSVQLKRFGGDLL